MNPTLDIILVNRNSGSMLRDCLQSIASVSKARFHLNRIVVVDDLSSDESLDGLDRSMLPLSILRNGRRIGYGASCNIGASGSKADYLLFLNTDTRLTPHSIDIPIGFITDPANRAFQMVGIQLLQARGTISRSCSRFPTIGLLLNAILGLDRLWPSLVHGPAMREWNHLDSRPVDQVIGAFLLLNRKLFVQLNGYDERFFVYYEDLDLSLRARALGIHNMYLATTHAYHFEGGTSRKDWPESMYFNRHSRIKYATKHFSPPAALVVALATLIVEPLIRSFYAVTQGSMAEMKANWISTCRLWHALLSRNAGRIPSA